MYSYRNKDSGGVDFMKYPVGTNFLKADEGEHEILIIPYEIKTKNHPLVSLGRKEIGDFDYVLTVDVHRSVGPEGRWIICPKKNYGKPCPICEEAGELAKTSTRAIYNVVNANRPEKGIHVLSVSDFLFQKELRDELIASSKDKIIPFADPVDGTIVYFRGRKEVTEGGNFVKYVSFKFRERGKELDDMYEKERWEEKSLSLDEYMIILSYDEIKDILYGRDNEDEEENGHKEEEKEDEDRTERRRKRREEENEENECPHGHRFGIDINNRKFDKDCDPCKKWDKCDAEETRRRKEKK